MIEAVDRIAAVTPDEHAAQRAARIERLREQYSQAGVHGREWPAESPSEVRRGAHEKLAKAVVVNGQRYRSCREAAFSTGISGVTIQACCQRRTGWARYRPKLQPGKLVRFEAWYDETCSRKGKLRKRQSRISSIRTRRP